MADVFEDDPAVGAALLERGREIAEVEHYSPPVDGIVLGAEFGEPAAPTSPAAIKHRHRHGDEETEHYHRHAHVHGDEPHWHGWHQQPEDCSGDDAFGEDVGFPREPTPELLPEEIGFVDGPGEWLVDVPYVPHRLNLHVVPAILAAGGTAHLWDVSRTQWDYWEMLRIRWAAGTDLVLVEHDVEIPATALEDFAECPEPWCVHDYTIRAFDGADRPIREQYDLRPGAFGCLRLRAEILAAVPDLVSSLEDRMWWKLDSYVNKALISLGERAGSRFPGLYPHRHEPDAIHHHDYATDKRFGRINA